MNHSEKLLGVGVSRGIAIGRAVVVARHAHLLEHHYITPTQVDDEITRLNAARLAMAEELRQLHDRLPEDAPPEMAALLEVHLMLLEDEDLAHDVQQWIRARHYNAEWALTSQLEVLVRQFDSMEEAYLRERKSDVEQVIQRLLEHLQTQSRPVTDLGQALAQVSPSQGKDTDPTILVMHDIHPADMLNLKRSAFAALVTEVGGQTCHTAIVARSMQLPATLGVHQALQHIQPDTLLIVDGEAGVVILHPDASLLAHYRQMQQDGIARQHDLLSLLHTPCTTLDGCTVTLHANIEGPQDIPSALRAGAVGVGLLRTEFLFMGRSQLPDEAIQFAAYRQVVEGMQGMPVTIRTLDIGADKSLHTPSLRGKETQVGHASPLGQRAIRWSLAEPEMFRTQLRAILRAAAYGKVNILIPMVSHVEQIQQTRTLLEQARAELEAKGQVSGNIRLGAMIETPASAIEIETLLLHLDFISIGTNDLIQYTLAVDRTDESLAPLYDPLHPAVLFLLARVFAAAQRAGKPASVCGEMAGDPQYTPLFLSLGLRTFSMHPSRMLEVKQQILRTDCTQL